MVGSMLIFGMGYTANRLADRLRSQGWTVVGTRRAASDDAIAFDDRDAVLRAIAASSHILSSVPPLPGGGDPVLHHYGAALAGHAARWTGYLSSTGVYGDTGGAWVDESAATGEGRRTERAEADRRWQVQATLFRLPGIYGPGRSALDRVRAGKAHRIDLPDQLFSRVHVDDIVSAVIASFECPRDIFNIADNYPCSQNRVIEFACDLLGLPYPPLHALEDAGLSAMARGFYAENRRVANEKAKRLLRWTPLYPDYKQGLAAIAHSESVKTD